MSEERMLILRMLQEGKISADEAARLLDAVAEQPPVHSRPPVPPQPPVQPQPPIEPPSGLGIADDIRRAVEDITRAIPKESIEEAKDVIRETVREGVEFARESARMAREAGRWGGKWGKWEWHLHGTLGGHHATAPFEDVRATTASHLIFRNTRGDLRLSRSPDGQLHVRATRRVWGSDPVEAQRLADRLPIEITESGDTITVEGPGARPYHERLRVDFVIAVPDALDVAGHLVRGDVTAEGLAHDLAFRVVKGDIRVVDCAAVDVQGVSSAVSLDRSRGDTSVRVIRGDVSVRQVSGNVDISTKRGDLDVRVDTAGQLAASTIRGDIHLRAREFASGGEGTAHTIRGDIAVYLGPTARCRIEAATLSGDISSTLPLTERREDRRTLSGVFNSADVDVHLRATRGDITLAMLKDDAVASRAAPA